MKGEIDMIDHAYSHWIGKTVGIKLDGIGIVAGTVVTPDMGQDHNYLSVITDDSTWHTVLAMETYRADFINSSLLS